MPFKIRNISLLLFGLLCALNSVSQSFHPPIENYSPKEYGIENTPENWDITQDNRGIIYSAVGNSILEYDGHSWRTIPVVNGRYTVSLSKSENGTIYVGAQQDFGKLEANSKGDLQYISLSSQLKDQTFSTIWETACIGSKVYFQSDESIFEYDGKTINTIKPETSFHKMFVVGDKLYARQRELGLSEFKNGRFEYCKGTDTLFNEGLFAMIPDGESIIMITREIGLWRYFPLQNKMVSLTSSDDNELVNAAILGGIRLSDNNIALNTIESGVLIINNEGHILKRINKKTGIRVNDVKSIFEDRENNLWLALNNGISKINYNSPLSFYAEESGLEGSVQAITHFKETLFVGTTSGLFIHTKNIFDKREFQQHPAIYSQVWAFLEYKDILLVGAGDGLYRLTQVGNAFETELLYQVNVNAIAHISSTNELLIAGGQGILILNAETFEEVDYNPILISGITGIAFNPKPLFSEEELWLGTNAMGLIRVQVKDGFYDFQTYAGEEDGLTNQWIQPYIIGDSVVFGDPEGLKSFKDEHYLIAEGDNFDEYIGLKGIFETYYVAGEKITLPVSEVIDTKTKLWACIDERIMYFNKRDKHTHVNRPFWGINFGRIGHFYLENDNTLWTGTADGLIRYKSNNKKDYEIPFYCIIRDVSVGKDSSIYGGGNGISALKNGQYELDYNHNSIAFNFSAPYFDDEHDIVFSYQLKGLSEDWSEWSKNTRIDFSALREGDYVFNVKAKNIYNKESAISTIEFTISPPWYRTTWAYILYGLAALALIFGAIRLSSLRLKQKNDQLEILVTERTQEIAAKNNALQNQKDEIEHQQKEIMDSINYAQRIQEAILPVDEELHLAFKDSFVLFLPKDIVSGDFYWFAQVHEHRVLVCADCTGHGVPGAFMSMIGSDKLNQFVKEKHVVNPSEILSHMNQGIKFSLKQVDDSSSTKDGMDAAIISYDPVAKKLQYAGANRSLWLIRNNELIETKATKNAVGGFTSDDQVFKLHSIDILEGDTVYLSSDGYADQFGGPKGKKLKVKVLKEMVLKHVHLPMSEQKDIYHNALKNWMGDLEQVDDVCFMGVRF